MEPLACCVRAVKRAEIQPSDVVVVVGLGSIGLLFMQLIRHAVVSVSVSISTQLAAS